MDLLKLKEKQIDDKKIILAQYTKNFFCVDCLTDELTYTIACFENLDEATKFFDKIIRI